MRTKYLDSGDFQHVDLTMDGRPALLVYGVVESLQTAWADHLSTLSGHQIRLGNRTAAAALIISDDDTQDTAWALTYGMGFQLLPTWVIDASFGQRILLRTADPSAIRSLTRTTLDKRSRTDRSSIPGGESARGFGVGDHGEIVSRSRNGLA